MTFQNSHGKSDAGNPAGKDYEVASKSLTEEEEKSNTMPWLLHVPIFSLMVISLVALLCVEATSYGPSIPEGNISVLRLQNITDANARLDQIKKYLVSMNVSTETSLDTEDSPQQQALNFMAVDDTFKMDIPVGNESNYEFITRYVLAVLYYATNDPVSPWMFDLNFLRPIPVCSWYSVLQYADQSTEYRGVACDSKSNEVVGLFLRENNLEGTVPEELGLLTSLEAIDLDKNILRGSIPDSFQSLLGLKNWFVSDNRITGTMPSWIGSLSSIRNINFAHNRMNGTLPTSLRDLEELEGIALDNNFFSGRLDAVFDTNTTTGLQKLNQFYIDRNFFTGMLSDNFLKESIDLEYLDVSNNWFSGSVPSHLFEFSNLTVLDVHENEFDDLPESFPVNSKLQMLALQKCNFGNQPIPGDVSNLHTLKHLDLSQNTFTGDIPSEISSLSNLTYLFLSENRFDPGPIPTWTQQMTALEELGLKTTQRTGTIPAFLGTELPKLIFLDLDNNELNGTIPESLGMLQDLHTLLLNRNNLNGEIPSSLGNLEQLKILFIEANSDLTGPLPCKDDSVYASSVIVADCDICDRYQRCCSECCPNGTACNDHVFVADFDPIWQWGYERVFYTVWKDNYFERNTDDELIPEGFYEDDDTDATTSSSATDPPEIPIVMERSGAA